MQNKQVEGIAVLEKIYDPDRLGSEIGQLSAAVQEDLQGMDSNGKLSYLELFKSREVRRALFTGVGLQVYSYKFSYLILQVKIDAPCSLF